MDMNSIGDIIKNSPVNNHSNIINNDINDNNGTSKKKYALDKNKFNPNTEQAQLAEEIATKFNDLNNFACYMSIVNRLGCAKTRMIYSQTLSDIDEKRDTKYPVRKPARYFVWKVQNGY